MTAVNTDLDPALAVIVHRALAKRGEDRYQELKALAADLTRVMQRIESAQAGHTMQADAHRPPPPAGRRLADPSRLAERRAARIAGHLDAAEAKLAAGDLDAALADAELAAEIDTEDPRVVRLHERIRHEIDARDVAQFVADAHGLIERGALTEAGAALSQAAALDPDADSVVACQQALARAREAYEQAQARAPGAADRARPRPQTPSPTAPSKRHCARRARRSASAATIEKRDRCSSTFASRSTVRFAPCSTRRATITPPAAPWRQSGGSTRSRPAGGRSTRRWRNTGRRLPTQERAALAAFVAQSVGEAERLLGEERWKDAIDVASRVRARAGERPELASIVSRAQHGIEVARRRAEAARLTTRARDELRAAHFEQASVLIREALGLAPDSYTAEHGAAAALASEIDAAWQADRDRRRREAEAVRAEAEARERAAQEARWRVEEEARREREEQARREAEARERLRARQTWLAQQLARARTALDSDHADAALEVLRAAQTRAPNEPAIVELLQRAEQQRALEQQRLAEVHRARVSVAWATAQFARGDQRVAIRHLERVARPHPLVAAALSELRSGRVPAVTLEDESPLEVDSAITLPDAE